MKGNEPMMKFKFKIDVNGGMTFHHTREVVSEGEYFEDAQDKAIDTLLEEYRGKVAFLNVIDFKRI